MLQRIEVTEVRGDQCKVKLTGPAGDSKAFEIDKNDIAAVTDAMFAFAFTGDNINWDMTTRNGDKRG